MATLVLVLLILAMTGHSSATWCICKDGLSESGLQKTLDYACGAGADCNPTHQNGPCYTPNTVRAHCNYAVNSYFQKKGQAAGSCDFAGTATVITTDPSTSGCSYPSSVSTAGSTTVTQTPITTTPSTSTTPSTTTPTTMTPTTATPYTGTGTSTGVLGGVGTGLGPSGINTDYSDGGFRLQQSISLFSFFTSLLMLLWV
ncbi:hypothetical protein SLA2020_003540 [Shorea laevis]